MQKKIDTMNRLIENGVVAVIRNIPKDKVVQVADSLIKGGVNALEVTLDGEDSFNVIDKLSREFSNQAIIGAGTVIDEVSAELAIRDGAEFIVSPLLDEDVIKATLRNGKISIPGAMTPTEMMTAVKLGAHIVKVFPASVGGPEFIKNVRGPLPQISIIPTGGVNVENAGDFIKAGAIAVGAGGNLVNVKAVAEGNYDKITKVAEQYIEAVKNARHSFT